MSDNTVPTWRQRLLNRWRRTAPKQIGTAASDAPGRRARIARRILVWGGALLVLFALAGFYVLPPIVKSLVMSKASQLLERQVTLRQVAINPFSMTLTLRGLSISERQASKEFVGFDELHVNVQAESLFRRAPVVREIRLQGPRVHVVRLDERTFNFSDLLRKFATPEKSPAPPAEPARFSLNNIQILGGRVEFDDRVKDATHVLSGLDVLLPFLSNLDYKVDDPVQPAVSGVFNGAAFGLKGSTKPFKDTHESSLDINIDKLELSRYLEYVPVDLDFKVPSATLSTRLNLTFAQPVEGPPLLRLSGHVSLQQVAVQTRASAPVFSLEALEVEVTSAEPLARRAKVSAIVLRRPDLHLTRREDGSLSIMALLPKADTGDAGVSPQSREATATSPSFAFDLGELRIERGVVRFIDEVPAEDFRVQVDPIELRVANFRMPQKSPAQIELSVVTSIGAVLRHEGNLLLDPLKVEGSVALGGIDFKALAPYYAPAVRFDVTDGTLQAATFYEFSRPDGEVDLRLSGLQASIAALAIRKRGATGRLFSLGELAITDTALDLRQRKVNVGTVTVRDAALEGRRDKTGAIDLLQLSAARDQAAPAAAPATAGAEAAPETPWNWRVGRISVERFKALFQDDLPAQPVRHTLDPVTLSAENLSNQSGSSGSVSLNLGVNKSGRVEVSGKLGLAPLTAALKTRIRALDLVPLQPYFTDKVNILLSSGALGLEGNVGLKPGVGDAPSVTYAGNLSITDLATVDKIGSEDFLKWKSLYLTSIRAVTAPFSLDIAEVALTDFYSRLIIYPDGRLNVQDIVASSPAAGPASAPDASPAPATTPTKSESPASSTAAGPPPPITIGKVTLQGGNINFSDRFIKPNYSANLTDMGGTVTGLSSQPGTTAALDLRGNLDKTAPLQITGRLNPLVNNLFLDVKASVRDIELGPLSPYSGKYVGYGIEKGKLAFDVKYLIENRKLQAENRLIVDQLTFGDKVESKDALSLPVKFAISLLKDKDGVIDINLPVGGSLDDPKFSIGGLVWKVIVNLLQKAVTAPFALIGSLFGDGPELSQLEFAPGSAGLSEDSVKRLEKLTQALTSRPALKLDVIGRTDRQQDLEGLRRQAFERQVKAQKLKDLVKRGESVASVDKVTVDKAEYEKYLSRAYKEGKFPKPRNVIGLPKDLPAPEMEKLMLTNVTVGEDDLIKLASERAQAAKDHLTKVGMIAPERVFLSAPKVAGDIGNGAGDAAKLSMRVDFVLK